MMPVSEELRLVEEEGVVLLAVSADVLLRLLHTRSLTLEEVQFLNARSQAMGRHALKAASTKFDSFVTEAAKPCNQPNTVYVD